MRMRYALAALLCLALHATAADEKAYKVMRVVDGDTIAVEIEGEQQAVRLIGVDTPETVHPSKPVETYGKEASSFTRNLLLGESVYLKPDQGDSLERDKYGRLLAYVYRAPDRLFVNAEIIRQGYGHAYTVYPFAKMDEFRVHEQAARTAGRGLWGVVTTTEAPKSAEVVTPAKPAAERVYLTSSGSRYHRAGCRYLSKSQIPTSLEYVAGKYRACSVCNPPSVTPEPEARYNVEPQRRSVLGGVDLGISGGSDGASSGGGTVRVRGYYRKDGTYVRPHTRSAPRR